MRDAARLILGAVCVPTGVSHVVTDTAPRLAVVSWLPGSGFLWQDVAGWALIAAGLWLALSVLMTGAARDWAPAAVVGVMGAWGLVSLAGWLLPGMHGVWTTHWVYATHFIAMSVTTGTAIIGPRRDAADAITKSRGE